jgi:hypothetical protein
MLDHLTSDSDSGEDKLEKELRKKEKVFGILHNFILIFLRMI